MTRLFSSVSSLACTVSGSGMESEIRMLPDFIFLWDQCFVLKDLYTGPFPTAAGLVGSLWRI